MRIVLASSSPRRKELLQKLIDSFEIIVPNVDEIEDGEPSDIVVSNAIKKGRAVTEGDIVIACDTVVALGKEVFGKPKDKEDAFRIIKLLSGRTHEVISGLYVRHGQKEIIEVEVSKVAFYDLSDTQIAEYIEKCHPLDKAGAYGIQDGYVVKGYEGSFDNIVGLPTEKLQKVLKEFKGVKEENRHSV